MPDFGETPELAESGSHSQNPGIGRIGPPPRGRGQTQELGCFWGRPQKPRKSRNSAEFGNSWKWLIPGGQTPRIGPNQGVRPPKTAQTDPKSPEKTPFRPKPTPKTSNSGVSDLRFRPKGGIPPKTQKSAHFLLSSPLKRPHFQESRLSSTKPPCFWHHPPVPGVAGN